MRKTIIRHYTTTGRFYLGRDEQQQQVVLITPAGTVSELWDDGDAPYDEEMLPSEVSKIIRERLNSYLIKTSREKNLAILDAIDARADEFDRDFMYSLASSLDEKADKMKAKAMRLRDSADAIGPTEPEINHTMDNLGFPRVEESQ